MTRQVGDKIGPRLVDLLARYNLAHRHALASAEARIRAAGMKIAVDQLGEEVAGHWEPLLRPLLRGDYGDLHPDVRQWLADVASGTHQWRSATGAIFGLSQSALGTVISNAVAPIAYALTEPSPNLRLDPVTLAGAVARQIVTMGSAVPDAAAQGYESDRLGVLVELARQIPDPSVLADMRNRGLITGGELEELLARGGFPPFLFAALAGLGRQLLSPADAALAVLRGNMPEAAGVDVAAAAGMIPSDFATLVLNTGEPPGLEQLQEAYRRGIIDRQRLDRGIRQSRVRNEWTDVVEALRFSPMSTADAADAALKGTLTAGQARVLSELNGLRPADWEPFWASQGTAPSDFQLLELHRRGFITEAQVDQGLAFNRIRPEWRPHIRQLSTTRLPSADALDAWLRGHLTREAAEDILQSNGLAAEDWAAAFGNAGNPLPLEQLQEAFRRGFIDRARFETGIRESRYRDEWTGVALDLRFHPMTTADAIEAAVQGHITVEQAQDITALNGLLPEHFRAAYETAGSPLSRTELEQLYNRGLIDRDTVVEGLRESRLKLKYIGDALQLHVRIPAEREVVRLLAAQVIDRDEAMRLLLDDGYTKQVAGWLVTEGEHTGAAKERDLALAQIMALYGDHLITREAAADLAAKLRFSPASVTLLLSLADHARHQRILSTGITAVRNAYLEYHLEELGVRDDLSKLGLPADAVTTYLATWKLERATRRKSLTEAQIVKAHKLALFDGRDPAKNTAEALLRLVQAGYTEGDAELLLAGA